MQLQLPIVKVLRLRRLLQLLGLLLLKLLMTRKLPPPPLQLATPVLQALLMIPLVPSLIPVLLRLRSHPAACQSARRRTRRRQRAELERARARAPPRRSGMAAVCRGASAPDDPAHGWGRRSPHPCPDEVVLRAQAGAPPHAQSRLLAAEALADAAARYAGDWRRWCGGASLRVQPGCRPRPVPSRLAGHGAAVARPERVERRRRRSVTSAVPAARHSAGAHRAASRCFHALHINPAAPAVAAHCHATIVAPAAVPAQAALLPARAVAARTRAVHLFPVALARAAVQPAVPAARAPVVLAPGYFLPARAGSAGLPERLNDAGHRLRGRRCNGAAACKRALPHARSRQLAH